MSFVRTYTKPKVFGVVTLGALVAGAVLGFVAKDSGVKWLSEALTTISTVFTNLLQFTVIPLVFTAIVVGVNSLRGLGGPRTATRLGGKTLLWFAITSFIAVVLGIVLGLIFQPGSGVQVAPTQANVARIEDRAAGNWWTFVQDLVPANFLEAFTEGEVLQVVFLALLVAAATYALGDRAKPFVTFNQAVFDVIQKVLGWIILLAPIGVLGLIGKAFATYGNQFIKPLFSLVWTVYLGAALIMFVVYPLLLRFVGRINPLRFFAKSWTALQFAFVSRSSGATLPLSRQSAVDLGVNPGYAGFAVPLGTTTKMDGCAALYPALASVFIANLAGIDLSIAQYIGIIAVAVFGALATAGTTGWFTMLTLTLSAINLPPEVTATGLAIVIAIDPILDMARTATNVAGQITVPVLVARQENLLDDEVLNTPAEELAEQRRREPVAV